MRRSTPHRTRAARANRPAATLLLMAGVCAALPGCKPGETDAWLWDQSVVGRWENTPTIVPILERIDVIERDEGESVEITQVTPEDLIPVVEEYEIGPGDTLRVSILDFLQQGLVSEFDLQVDITGALDIPQLGRVPLQGMTPDQARQAISRAIVDRGISVEEPMVSLQPLAMRQATFSIYGAITGVGRYSIPKPDYRLLDALTEAGGVSSSLRKVQVIRQVILSEELKRGAGATPRGGLRPAIDTSPSTVDLDSLIQELTAPEGEKPAAAPGAGAAPGDRPVGEAPAIDLVEDDKPSGPTPAGEAGSSWMFLDGQWVQVTGRKPGASAPSESSASARPADGLVTQRVIEVPIPPLLRGLAQYNVVIRPGDVINIPLSDQGLVYVTGPGIARGGVYELPTIGRLTLKQAVAAAGGLSQIAIPERVDLTRRVGEAREATIRLNLRAIFEGTQPDVFLKPEDQLNFGTNFFATPLAIIRNGFRMTYGFGFLMDRNFGNDVFGPEPVNRFGN